MAHVNDKSLEKLIGVLLRCGVLLSAAMVLAGAILYLLQSGGQHVHYSTFQPMSSELTTIAGIFSAAVHFKAGAVIQLGVLLLIVTPVARVALAMVGFSLERDYLYTLVSAVVLAVLLYSLSHTG